MSIAILAVFFKIFFIYDDYFQLILQQEKPKKTKTIFIPAIYLY